MSNEFKYVTVGNSVFLVFRNGTSINMNSVKVIKEGKDENTIRFVHDFKPEGNYYTEVEIDYDCRRADQTPGFDRFMKFFKKYLQK
jgi:hypothetical protein